MLIVLEAPTAIPGTTPDHNGNSVLSNPLVLRPNSLIPLSDSCLLRVGIERALFLRLCMQDSAKEPVPSNLSWTSTKENNSSSPEDPSGLASFLENAKSHR